MVTAARPSWPGPDVAVLSGSPAFDRTLHVGRPNRVDNDRVLSRIRGALERGWLTNNGPLVQEFEHRVADYVGTNHCIATCNATTALELVLRALALSGDVIVPSWTFIADAHAISRSGLRPSFCDVDADSHCLDPASVEAAITPETSAILAVHLWGNGCNVRALEAIAESHGLDLVFDAAHAFGCRHDGQMIGGFGRAEIVSFHATKMISCFEGGAVLTNDDDLADLLRLERNFGFMSEDVVHRIGTNAKMSEASAAMGITSLEAVDEILEHNRSIHTVYREALAEVPGLRLLVVGADEESNRHYTVLEVENPRDGLSRDELVAMLRLENVVARRYFHPGCHRQDPYRRADRTMAASLGVTEELADRVMVLPTGLDVCPRDVRIICDRIAAAVAQAPRVRQALRTVVDERITDIR